MPEPALATISQACAFLQETPWQLWKLRRDGGGPKFIVLGRSRVRYGWDDLRQYAADLKRFSSIADRNRFDLERRPNARRQAEGAAYARSRKGKRRAQEAAPTTDDGQTAA
jgi:hypothetical protein